MVDLIRANAGNILVGAIVFAALAAVLIRLIINIRRGKTGCSCGCPGCEKSRAAPRPTA